MREEHKKTYKFEAPRIRIHEDEMRALLSDSEMARTKMSTMDASQDLSYSTTLFTWKQSCLRDRTDSISARERDPNNGHRTCGQDQTENTE